MTEREEKCKSCGGIAIWQTAVRILGDWISESNCDECYRLYAAAVDKEWRKKPWAYGEVRLG